MNVIFLGTPEFAVPALNAVFSSNHKILAVISQPDRETDKKGQLKHTAVKAAALNLELNVYQFEKVSTQGFELVENLKPDVMITAAFGQLLSAEFLSLSKKGVYNIHASLLPSYRGSSPIHAAILDGSKESGVTVMRTVLKMDAGDIAGVKSCKMDENTTFTELHDKLSVLGAELIVRVLDEIENGTEVFTAQDEAKATYTKKIVKTDGLINWSESGKIIKRKINAFNPWPSTFTFHNGNNLKILSADFIPDAQALQGEVISADGKNGLIVGCGEGALKISTVQAPGKKALNADEFLRGYKLSKGEVLG